ncbi:MAG: hypothetical protein ACOCZ5_01070 [bacterium]
MEIIATEMGFVLKFENIDDLKRVHKNTGEMAEWVEEENIEPPYLYVTYDESIDSEKIRGLIDRIKDNNSEK